MFTNPNCPFWVNQRIVGAIGSAKHLELLERGQCLVHLPFLLLLKISVCKIAIFVSRQSWFASRWLLLRHGWEVFGVRRSRRVPFQILIRMDNSGETYPVCCTIIGHNMIRFTLRLTLTNLYIELALLFLGFLLEQARRRSSGLMLVQCCGLTGGFD